MLIPATTTRSTPPTITLSASTPSATPAIASRRPAPPSVGALARPIAPVTIAVSALVGTTTHAPHDATGMQQHIMLATATSPLISDASARSFDCAVNPEGGSGGGASGALIALMVAARSRPRKPRMRRAHGRRRLRAMRAPALSALLAIGLALAACGPPRSSGVVREYPGTLRAPSAYEGDFALDHAVAAIHAEGTEHFRAVVEKRGDRIVLVGLAGHGGRAFAITQAGTEVSLERFVDRELPFPARYVLLDFHRAWLAGLPGAPLADGEHRAELDGEEVTEVWADGLLVTRTFRRLDGAAEGVIRVTYEPGLDPRLDAPTPERVELDNGWFGYRLAITGITRHPL